MVPTLESLRKRNDKTPVSVALLGLYLSIL
jgi:DNA transposition AAA+ family ATPase